MRPHANTKATAEFIRSYIDEHGYSPTYREISQGVGVNLSTTHHHIQKLLDAGEITMVPSQPRTLRMTAKSVRV